ncbi:hypothetical protein [Aestuariibius sp. HNIBRBA575]|uniref:hypothetical protein n=1 Tax=Aestuariibius sp. HNIBRBA575 TaxID=3233343 RepID=UPI0034A59F99
MGAQTSAEFFEGTAMPAVPMIQGFDPDVETLSFTLSEDDMDATLRLEDLADQTGVRLSIGDRLIAVLFGVRADDLEPGCLQFEFE